MFSWFLKLLGIDEDRPTASGNSYLNTNAASAKSDAVESIETKTAEKPKPAPEEPEPAPAPKEVAATSAEVTEPAPKAALKAALKAEAEPASKSLADEFPGLKANYVKVLEEAGFTTKTLIDKASDKDLLALKGIGKATLKIIRG